MALTTCPECQGQVSDAADTCPHCGFPLTQQQGRHETPTAVTPTEPGWYNDPSGEASYQAYWDGKKWTGAVRSGPGAQVSMPAKKGIPGWVWVVVILGGAAVIWAASQLGAESGGDLRTFSEIASALDNDSSGSSAANDRVTLEGSGEAESAAFSLSGGSYRVVTEVGNDCFYSFTLRDPSDGSRIKSVTSMTDVGSTTVSVHGLKAGRYYVDVITGPAPDCPWKETWTSSP